MMLTMAQNHGPPFHGHEPAPDGSDMNWQQHYGTALSHRPPHDAFANPPVIPHPGPAAEVKPRLTKVQHDLLEKWFQQQNKPTTATKKTYALQLGVPLEKINNWFQNRRAKVKQDAKKQQNNLHNIQLYSGMPPHLPYSHAQQHNMPLPYVPNGTLGSDVSPTSIPSEMVQEMGGMPSQLQVNQDFGSGLHPISESMRPGSAEAIMSNLIGAGYNPPMMQNVPFDPSQQEFQDAFPETAHGSISADGPGAMMHFNAESSGMRDLDFAVDAYDCSATPPEKTDSLMGPVSSDTSPFSGTDSTPQVLPTTEGPSFDWNESNSHQPYEPSNSDTNVPPSVQHLQVPMMRAGFANSQDYHQRALPSQDLTETAQFEQHVLHGNLQGSPDQQQAALPDMFTRRNSSTTALTESMSAVGIHTQQQSTNVEFKQPAPPSNIAERRRAPRPAALGSASLRSASYSSGKPPSPGAPHSANDLTLRRIRSSGVPNGRISKNPSSSAQRSPLSFTFGGATTSPKFSRQSSFNLVSSSDGLPTSGSFAPPTPSTPNELGVFPPWQNGGQPKAQPGVPDYSGPDTLNAPSVYATSAAGSHTNLSSPPHTPLDAQQFAQYHAHFSNNPIFHNTPPQSAPVTQQSFSRTALSHPQSASEYLAPTDFPGSREMQMQFRRPSLPEAILVPDSTHHGQGPMPVATAAGDIHAVYSHQFVQDQMQLMQQQQQQQQHCAAAQMGPFSHDGMLMPNAMEAPRATSMPDLFVHEYTPPRVRGQTPPLRPQQDSGPKNYIFTNTGPEHFNKRGEQE